MTDLPELTCFRVDLDDHVAHVRMSRPDRANSMIPAFWRELPLIVEQLAAQARARVIVLSGEGRHFCSGMDTTVFTAPGGPGSEQRPDREHSPAWSEGFRSTAMRLQRAISSLEQARIPAICAIQGACIGGGLDLATAADLRTRPRMRSSRSTRSTSAWPPTSGRSNGCRS